jgi:polysaccharide pyruvyl transferase CsaB
MRLAVSGYYGFGNTGDEAILAGLLRSLRDIEPELKVTVLSGDPARTERVHGVDAIPRMAPAAIVRSLRNADGLLSGGGGLLQDRTSARPVAYYAGLMLTARLMGRPYVVHAQGLGPIRRAVNRRIAATALRGAAEVSLRDDASIALARAIGVRRPIELVPDPALALEPRVEPGPDAPVLVAVRSWPASLPYLEPLRDALGLLRDVGPIVALPMQGAADLEASRAVVGGVPGARVLDPDLALDDVVDAIGSARLVIAMRLHALILAAAAGIPAVGISYDPKVDAFAERAGQPVVARIDEPVDAASLADAARRALDAGTSATVARVAAMRGELRRAAERSLSALHEGRR